MPPTLHILTGPTAVGKTEWALRWAEANDAEIISCDSLLFYRGMNVGTAKPTPAELARVRHHLIDLRPVDQPMDVTHYVTLARAAADAISRRGRRILVTGGSGFYLKSFFAAIADDIEVPAEIRERVRALSLAAAVAQLRELNPAGLGELDIANPRRVARALERCLASGRALEALRADFERLPSPFADWQIRVTVLERDPKELERRIAVRVEQMLRAGLVEEVRELRSAGLERNPSAAKAIGYREVLALLDGTLSETQLAATIAKNTRALVKKQRTWFRTQLPEHRVLDAARISGPAELF